MTTLRGRAASPVRSGILIKRILNGEYPLVTGELAMESAITDIHSSYKMFVNGINQLRPKKFHLKPMNHASFYTLFKFARLLGLVEFVREEPMVSPPPTGTLYMIENIGQGKVRAVPSARRIFRLSAKGMEDQRSWTDLRKAWMEKWPAPDKSDYFPTIEDMKAIGIIVEKPKKVAPERIVPEKAPAARRGRPPKVVTEVEVPELEAPIPSFKWTSTPSKRQYTKLLDHLVDLQKLDQTREDVIKHIISMETRVGDWAVETEYNRDEAKDAGKVAKAEKLSVEAKLLSKLFESVLDRDLTSAIEDTRELTLL